jgi:hypothetical protein
MRLYCCGAIESVELLQFPYAAQPILCVPAGLEWRRVDYEIVGGTVSNLRTVGHARRLEEHSFRLGDYVLCDPQPFDTSSRLVVLSAHHVVISRSLVHLAIELAAGVRGEPSRRVLSYLARSSHVLAAAAAADWSDRGRSKPRYRG